MQVQENCSFQDSVSDFHYQRFAIGEAVNPMAGPADGPAHSPLKDFA